jgi:hypothetical protein
MVKSTLLYVATRLEASREIQPIGYQVFGVVSLPVGWQSEPGDG